MGDLDWYKESSDLEPFRRRARPLSLSESVSFANNVYYGRR